MAKSTQSYGVCKLCGYRSNKAGMSKHLTKCILEHPGLMKGKAGGIVQLRVEDAAKPSPFWLDLEIKASEPLQTLDGFLRGIWLECCGHLSAFEINRTRYEVMVDRSWGNDSKSMSAKLSQVLTPGMSFSHEYDYGSTTLLNLKVVGEREGQMAQPLRLLARNEAPEWKCNVCEEPATQLDTECGWEMDNPFFCDQHADEHTQQQHDGDNYMFSPVVNSPRMGVCGYNGPADESPYLERS